MPKSHPLNKDRRTIEQLIEAAKEARTRIIAAREANQPRLELMKQAGDALNRLRFKEQRWPRRKWQNWLIVSFDGDMSLEEAEFYIRLSKAWDRPAMIKARKEGRHIDCLREYEQAVRAARPAKQPVPKTEVDRLLKQLVTRLAKVMRSGIREREYLISWFPKKLRPPQPRRNQFKVHATGLEKEEITYLLENLDTLWPKLRREVYQGTCAAMELELDEYLLEAGRWETSPREPMDNVSLVNKRAKTEVRQKVKQLLTQRGNRRMSKAEVRRRRSQHSIEKARGR